MRAENHEIASTKRSRLPLSPAWLMLLGAVVFAACASLDGWAMAQLDAPRAKLFDWARLLRVLGYVPTWIVVMAALWCGGGRPLRMGPTREGAGALLGCILAGLSAEVIKLLVRRERPGVSHGLWSFRPITDQPYSSLDLSFPSSHTMVAFGAAWALVMLRPRGAWLWLGLAAGTGLTRVLDGAHYLSDIAASAVLAVPASVLAVRLAEHGARLVEAPSPGEGGAA